MSTSALSMAVCSCPSVGWPCSLVEEVANFSSEGPGAGLSWSGLSPALRQTSGVVITIINMGNRKNVLHVCYLLGSCSSLFYLPSILLVALPAVQVIECWDHL